MIIFYFVPYFPPNIKGGAEISLKLLALELARRGHEVHIFTPNYNKSDEKVNNGYVIHLIGWDKEGVWSLNNPFALLKIYRYVKRQKINPEIIDSYNWPLAAWFIAKKLKKSFVLSIRDLTPLSDLRVDVLPRRYNFFEYYKVRFDNFGFSLDQIIYGLYGYGLTIMNQKALKQADGLTFASKALMKAYNGFNKNNICINSVVVLPKQRCDIKRKMQVLYVGRFSQGKGFNFLITIAKSIIDQGKFKKLSFVFIGSGEQPRVGKRYKERIKVLGKLSHDQTLNNIQRSRLVVVPSQIFDAFPRSIVESLSYGTPVIATDVGGSKEALGGAGILVEAGNELELKQAILKLTDDRKLWDKYSKNGIEQIEQYSPEIISTKTEQFYKKILQ